MRNESIFKEYQSGISVVELSKKHGVSRQRIHQIAQKISRETGEPLRKNLKRAATPAKKARWDRQILNFSDEEIAEFIASPSLTQFAKDNELNYTSASMRFNRQGISPGAIRNEREARKTEEMYQRWAGGEHWSTIAADYGLRHMTFYVRIHRYMKKHGIPGTHKFRCKRLAKQSRNGHTLKP